MSDLIAVAGKGGVGKTTFCALTVRYLIKKGLRPVLAIDADANLNFNEVLGVEIKQTVGGVRDDLLKNMGMLPAGMSKDAWIEMQLQESMVETKDFDLVAMGKPEGTGCYCYVNSVLQRYMEILQNNYPYIVMDNEAGMEHISRGTTNDVSYLLIVSDASPRGVRTAARIRDLVNELSVKVGGMGLVLNRLLNEEMTNAALAEAKKRELELIGVIPADDLLLKYDMNDRSLLELPDDSAAIQAASKILDDVTGKLAKAG
ncbi:MAG: AAA family ATPase [Actinomycetia bacterium]|nr:AAA family ATPase [Actinomycetes bacterium]